jgi:hypothetical protein
VLHSTQSKLLVYSIRRASAILALRVITAQLHRFALSAPRHDAPVKADSSYEDPSFGKRVAMMKAGLTDTLLVCAARHGRVTTMELLIEMHADVNQQSGYGETPLFAACLESHVRAVRVLVEAGARLDFVHDMTGLNIL